jgi:hypothetical protein
MPNNFSGSKKSEFKPFKQFKKFKSTKAKPGSYLSGFLCAAEIAPVKQNHFGCAVEGWLEQPRFNLPLPKARQIDSGVIPAKVCGNNGRAEVD